MSTASLDILPSANDCKKRIAELEGDRASELMRAEAAKAAEKKALLDQLAKPSGVSDERPAFGGSFGRASCGGPAADRGGRLRRDYEQPDIIARIRHRNSGDFAHRGLPCFHDV